MILRLHRLPGHVPSSPVFFFFFCKYGDDGDPKDVVKVGIVKIIYIIPISISIFRVVFCSMVSYDGD